MPHNTEPIPAQIVPQTKSESESPKDVPPLTSLYLYIAGNCNLACRHCWIVPTYVPSKGGGEAVDNSLGYIKLEHVSKAIREAKPLGLQSVKLTGGEPTLHPQFRELLTLIHNEGLRIHIETNGTLIDKDLARFMKEAGVEFVSVSLDGARAETHDHMRGVPGSYDRALAGIRALAAVGYPVQAICTLHRGNVAEVDELITLSEALGCDSIKFNILQPVGRGERFDENNGLAVPDIIQLYQRLENDVAPHSGVRILYDVPVAFHPINRLLKAGGHCSVRNILGILSGGELSLCGIGVTTPELIYGHIERDALRDVWYNNPQLKLLREQIPAQLEGICSECIHRESCLGTCIAHNYYSSGRLNAPFWFCQAADALGLFSDSRKQLSVADRVESFDHPNCQEE
jgi:SynChlorMet cassette radical SAM/SPASM protein ScmF